MLLGSRFIMQQRPKPLGSSAGLVTRDATFPAVGSTSGYLLQVDGKSHYRRLISTSPVSAFIRREVELRGTVLAGPHRAGLGSGSKARSEVVAPSADREE